MSPRPPTGDSLVWFFGDELSRYRAAKGWTQDELAGRLGWSPSLVSSVEQGRRKPPYGLGEQADAVLHLPGVLTRLADRARRDTTAFGDLLDLEARATLIRIFDSRVVPGLLQTPEYARVIIDAADMDSSPEQVDEQARARMLRKENAPPLHVVLDEAVLCRVIGDERVMREQLGELAAPRRSVTIQVLPFASGAHAAVEGPLRVMRIPDEPDVAYADGWSRGQVVDHPGEVLRAQRAFDHVAAVALPPDVSAELIQAYAEEL